MTEQERRIARQLIDEARRQRLLAETAARQADAGVVEARYCEYCAEPFTPRTHNQRFCCDTHSNRAWRNTEHGRLSGRNQKRRQRAARREEQVA